MSPLGSPVLMLEGQAFLDKGPDVESGGVVGEPAQHDAIVPISQVLTVDLVVLILSVEPMFDHSVPEVEVEAQHQQAEAAPEHQLHEHTVRFVQDVEH